MPTSKFYVGRRRRPADSRRHARLVTRSGALKGAAFVGLIGTVGAALALPADHLDDAFQAGVASPAALVRQDSQLRENWTQASRASRGYVRGALGAGTSDDRAGAAVVAPTGPTKGIQAGLVGVTAIPMPVPAATSATATKAASAVAAAVPAGASGAGLDTTTFASAGAAIGLGPNGRRVYSAVRAKFGLTNIGGYRPGDPLDHGKGNAADIMVSNFATGDAVAAFVQANAATLGVKYIIWKQAIWFPGSKTWRGMADRGSPTQNHYDHVHVSVH